VRANDDKSRIESFCLPVEGDLSLSIDEQCFGLHPDGRDGIVEGGLRLLLEPGGGTRSQVAGRYRSRAVCGQQRQRAVEFDKASGLTCRLQAFR
jgi:hypothetical protein